MPAVDAFELALALGMGWGMVHDLLLQSNAAHQARKTLAEVLPGRTVDVALYWQHWAQEPLLAQRLTQAVKASAKARLLPLV